jgi:branched-chain amino acid transport system permease protein
MGVDLPCGTFNRTYSEDLTIVRTRARWALFIGFLLFLFVIPPFLLSRQIIGMINTVAYITIAVQGLNIVTGYCGQIHLGQAAFMAIGGYTSAILATEFHLPFYLCLPFAGLASTLVGIIFGLPAVRVKGFYLALTTLAAQFIIIYIIQTPAAPITKGVYSLHVPPAQLGPLVFDSEKKIYFLVMVVAILMGFFAKNLARTKIGRNFVAIRDNDLAAEVMGIHIFRYKILAFAICSFYAGVAGSLYAYSAGVITTDYFPLADSIWYVGMLIIGGMGSVLGPIFGTLFIRLLVEVTTALTPILTQAFPRMGEGAFSSLSEFVFAMAIAFFLIGEPRGLAHRWEIFKNSYRLWPFSY